MNVWPITAAAAMVLTIAACGPASEPQSTNTETAAAEEVAVTEASASSDFSEFVGSDGSISFPADYKSWTHLGTWGVVNEGGEGNGVHNVFTSSDTIDAFNATGEFPDGAVLVKEVLASEGAPLTTGAANWATDHQVWFVMIKDSEGRFPGNDLWGNGWGWALFQADDPTKQVATNFEADCLGCHVPAQDTDWIYTYAYPALRAAR